jgi:hypothetical protein
MVNEVVFGDGGWGIYALSSFVVVGAGALVGRDTCGISVADSVILAVFQLIYGGAVRVMCAVASCVGKLFTTGCRAALGLILFYLGSTKAAAQMYLSSNGPT